MTNARRLALSHLVESSYAAAYDPTRWTDVLQDLARTLNAQGAGFVSYARDCSESSVSLYTGVSDFAITDYTEHYASVNTWMRHGGPKLRSGMTHTNEQMCPREIMRKSEFYNDWLAPNDIAEAMGATIFAEPQLVTNLTVMRPERCGPYSSSDFAFVRRLVPHLQCATMLHRRLSLAQQRARVERAALDALPVPVLAVDAACYIKFANAAAQALLAARDGLEDNRASLITSDHREAVELRRLVANAACTPRDADRVPGAMSISRPSLRRALAVLVTPLWSHAAGVQAAPGDSGALLFVADPEATHGPSEDLLRRCYGLTPAECTVAVSLARGSTISETATSLHIRRATARRHVQRVFLKTGTRTQADLVALLLSGPVRLNPALASADR